MIFFVNLKHFPRLWAQLLIYFRHRVLKKEVNYIHDGSACRDM